jgi:hypothetical protein
MHAVVRAGSHLTDESQRMTSYRNVIERGHLLALQPTATRQVGNLHGVLRVERGEERVDGLDAPQCMLVCTQQLFDPASFTTPSDPSADGRMTRWTTHSLACSRASCWSDSTVSASMKSKSVLPRSPPTITGSTGVPCSCPNTPSISRSSCSSVLVPMRPHPLRSRENTQPTIPASARRPSPWRRLARSAA